MAKVNKATYRGQTILEVVIALAIFIFISSSLAALILGGVNAAQQGAQHLEADALSQEGMEGLLSIRNGAWNELTQSPTGISVSDGQWVLSGTQDAIAPFTRTLTINSVCRSAGGDIAACPGVFVDPHTFFATSAVSWTTIEGAQNQVARSSYLTFWDSLLWTQTDWSGGAGQNIWLLPNRYESDDGQINSALSGTVQLGQNIGSGTWSLHTQIPGADALRDIAIISSQDIWAVGDDGTIVHYDGSAWTSVSSPISEGINAIFMLSATSGWAVANNGRIIRYNGTSWTQVSSPVNDRLNAIWMVSENDGWAVGEAGKILRYNGTSWFQFTDTGGNNWYDIQIVSASDGWVVGNQGYIYRWDGATWNPHTDSGGTVWRSLYILSANDGWAVGDQGYIYRWNGTSWLLNTDTGGTNWRTAHFPAANDGWAAGTGGDIYRWNGASWSSYTSSITADISEVNMLSSGLGWLVGNGGRIFQYQGQAYFTNGMLASSAFFMGDASPVAVIEWDEQIPVCAPLCDIRFQVRTAPNNAGAPGIFGSWYGANGVDTYFSTPNGSIIPAGVNENQWVQYRVFFDGDGQSTPGLSETRIYYK